jgi:hypothetical protein
MGFYMKASERQVMGWRLLRVPGRGKVNLGVPEKTNLPEEKGGAQVWSKG